MTDRDLIALALLSKGTHASYASVYNSKADDILAKLAAAGRVIVPREPLVKLAAITSVPSMTITYEQGWVIIDVVQKELLTTETRALIAAAIRIDEEPPS